MPKSALTTGFILLVVVIVIAIGALLSSTAPKGVSSGRGGGGGGRIITTTTTSGGGTTSSSSGGGGGGGAGGTSPGPTRFNTFQVQVNSISQITIGLTITGELPTSIEIAIYSDSTATTNLVANVNVTTGIQNNFQYIWNNITQIQYDTNYYIKASSGSLSTSIMNFRIPNPSQDPLQGCRTPVTYTPPAPEPPLIQQIFRQLLTEMIPMLVVGYYTDRFLSRALGIVAGTTTGANKYIKEFMKTRKEIRTITIKAVERGLMRTDRQYRLAKFFSVLSAEQLSRMGLSLTEYLKKLQKTNPARYTALIAEIDSIAVRVTGMTRNQLARMAAAEAAQASGEAVGKMVTRRVGSFLDSLGIASFAIDVTDMACQFITDEQREEFERNSPFGCPKWSQIDDSKTSDFLKYREDIITNLISDYNEFYTNSGEPIPPISDEQNIYLNLIGPLSKINPRTKREEVYQTMIDLFFLGETIETDQDIRKFAEAFVNNNGTGPVSDINDIPQIAIIRTIQDRLARPFVNSMQCVSPSTCTRANFMGQGLAEGTFEVFTDYSSIVSSNPITLMNYLIPADGGIDFAHGATFMFNNPGIPIDENFYVRFNRQYIAFIIGHITCSASSPALFAGYFIDNKGILQTGIPSFSGPITNFEVGILHEPKPNSSPKSCAEPDTIPNGDCIRAALEGVIRQVVTDSDWDDIFKIANEYVCYKYNGKYIRKNNQCSYKTATGCHNSYKWPDIIDTNSEVWPKLTFGINTDPNVLSIFDTIKNSKQVLMYKKDLYVLTNTNLFKYVNFYDGITKSGGYTGWQSATQVFPTLTLNQPTCFAIYEDKVYEDTMYIGESSGRIIKISSFGETSQTINVNYIPASSPPTQPIISICAVNNSYILISYANRISRVSDGRYVTPEYVSVNGTKQITISNPVHMIFENPYIFIINDGGKKISRISFYSFSDIEENWYGNGVMNPTSTQLSGTIPTIRYIYTENDEDEGFINMYVASDNEIVKIKDCTGDSPVVEQNIISSVLDKIKTSLDLNDNADDKKLNFTYPWLTVKDFPNKVLERIDNIGNNIKYVIRCNDTLVYTRVNESNVYGFYGELTWDSKFPGTQPTRDQSYAEWRTNFDHLRRDLGTDFSDDPSANGGLCVGWNYIHRQQCNSVFVGEDDERNTYNINTGECINTPDFCHSYGVPLKRSVPIDDLGRKESGLYADVWTWRASGPLDSCVIPEAYKALDWTILSRNIVQAFVALGYTLASYAFRRNLGFMAFATLRGIFNFGRPSSSVNLDDTEAIYYLATAAAQGSSEAYITLFNSVLADAKKRMDEKSRENRCKCTYEDGQWTQYIEAPPAPLGVATLRINVGACLHKSVDNTELGYANPMGKPCKPGYYPNGAYGLTERCEAAIEYNIDEDNCEDRIHKLAYAQKNQSVGDYTETIGDFCFRTVSPRPWGSCARPDLTEGLTQEQINDILLDRPGAVTDRPNLDPSLAAALASGIPPDVSRYGCTYATPRDTIGDRLGVQTRGLQWHADCDVENGRLEAIQKMSRTRDTRTIMAQECMTIDDSTCFSLSSAYTELKNYDIGADGGSPTSRVLGPFETVLDCKATCENNPTTCKGFVFVPSSRTCNFTTNMTGLYHSTDRESYIKQTPNYPKTQDKNIVGFDIGSSYSSLSTCRTACDNDSTCKGIVHDKSRNTCFKKSRITSPTPNTDFDLYTKKASTGTYYTKLSGKDLSGSDIGTCTNLDDCRNECDADPNCKGIVKNTSNGTYNKKAQVNGMTDATNRDFYVKQPNAGRGKFDLFNRGLTKCVQPLGGVANNGTNVVVNQACNTAQTLFEMTPAGSIKHVQTGKCLHPSGGTALSGVDLVFFDGCDENRLAFDVTSKGALRHRQTGLCVHNHNAGEANDTKLVLYDGCDDDATNRLYYDTVTKRY